jgi:NADPH:quinone reductase-like Zn-dependent oxidoreductase
LAALRVGQARGDRRQLVADLRGAAGGERPPFPRQPHPHGAAVVRVGDPLDQATGLGAVDQAGDARLVELQVAGEHEDPRFAVAQDAQQPHLDHREVEARRDSPQHSLDQERGLDERVGEVQLIVWHAGSLASWLVSPTNFVSITNYAHYTSEGELPLVPGVDAVGRAPDGGIAYFVAGDGVPGTMAERAVMDTRRSVPLSDRFDAVAIAAAMNPGMSSWVGLRRRAELEPGESVLVLGATGNAGRMAVQIAKHLGAGEVVAAGRNPEALAALPALGADRVVALGGGERDEGADEEDGMAELGEAAAEVDVVIDYLWGAPAEAAIPAIVRRRQDRARALRWVQIGSVAGPDVALPSAALRAANLKVMGSGQGSVTTAGIVAELPALAHEIDAGSFAVDAEPVPLAEVEPAWTAPVATGRRLVFVP